MLLAVPTLLKEFLRLLLSKVQIKVFYVLGNLTETLFNKEKPAGTYEIMWNAANLLSGIFLSIEDHAWLWTSKLLYSN